MERFEEYVCLFLEADCRVGNLGSKRSASERCMLMKGQMLSFNSGTGGQMPVRAAHLHLSSSSLRLDCGFLPICHIRSGLRPQKHTFRSGLMTRGRLGLRLRPPTSGLTASAPAAAAIQADTRPPRTTTAFTRQRQQEPPQAFPSPHEQHTPRPQGSRQPFRIPPAAA